MKRPRILTGLMVYTVLGFVPMATNFVVVPIYLGHLPSEQYGVVALANLAQVFSTLLVVLNVVAAFNRYFFDDGESERHLSSLAWTTLIFVTLSTCAFAGLSTLFGASVYGLALPTLPFQPFGYLVLIGVWAQTAQMIAFAYFRNHERPLAAASCTLVPFFLATAGTAIGVIALDWGAVGAYGGRILGTLAGVVPVTIALLWGRRPSFSSELLRKMLAYSLPLVGYAVLNNLLFQGDRLLAERWYGLSLLGMYAIAVTIASPIDILANSAYQATMPHIFRGLARGSAHVRFFAGSYFDALTCAATGLMLGAVFLSRPFLELIGREEYIQAARFVPLLAFGQLFRVRYRCVSTPLFFFERTRLLPVTNLAAIVVGLVVAFAARPLVGDLALGLGVAAWKWAQQATSQLFVVRDGLEPFVTRRSSAMIALAGAFVALFHVFGGGDDPWDWRIGLSAAILVAVAGALGVRSARAARASLQELRAEEAQVKGEQAGQPTPAEEPAPARAI